MILRSEPNGRAGASKFGGLPAASLARPTNATCIQTKMLVLLLLLSLAAAVAGGPPAHLTLAASLQRLHERAGALGPAGRLELRDLTAKHRAYTLQNRTAQWAWAAPPPPRQPVKTVPAGKVRGSRALLRAASDSHALVQLSAVSAAWVSG